MRGEEERSRRPRRERPVFSRWASNTKGCTSSTLPWPLSLPDSLPHLPWATLPPLPPPGFGLSPRIRPRRPGVGGGATRDNTGTALRTGLRGGARQRDTARTKHGEVMAAGSGAGNMLPPWNELQSRLAIPTPAKNGALYGNTTGEIHSLSIFAKASATAAPRASDREHGWAIASPVTGVGTCSNFRGKEWSSNR